MRNRRKSGFSLVEVMVVVAIVGALAAAAVPNFREWMQNSRVRSSARSVADAFHVARTEAMRTGNIHVVLLGSDISFAPVLGPDGNPEIRVFDDGRLGTGNCAPDPGENERRFPLGQNVVLGVTNGTTPAPDDVGVGATPITFTQPRAGNPAAAWIAFGPDGVPIGLTNTCQPGRIGSGGGAVYVTNGAVDYVVAMTRLGAVRASVWEDQEGAWQ